MLCKLPEMKMVSSSKLEIKDDVSIGNISIESLRAILANPTKLLDKLKLIEDMMSKKGHRAGTLDEANKILNSAVCGDHKDQQYLELDPINYDHSEWDKK